MITKFSRTLDTNCGKIWYVSDPLHSYADIGKAEIFHV